MQHFFRQGKTFFLLTPFFQTRPNKYVMSSLLAQGFAGKIDLIYIDPPFATGADFSFRAQIGEGDLETEKEQSIIEEKAYRDTWGRGLDSYFSMIYERLVLMGEMLTDRGSIYVHLDDTVGHYVKLVLDEMFGKACFQTQIIWQRVTGHSDRQGFAINHDLILHYSRGGNIIWNPQYQAYDKAYLKTHYRSVDQLSHPPGPLPQA